MNELKPEDVMRALECCSRDDGCVGEECPYHAGVFCVTRISKDALALIREKDAEIERLKNSITFQVVIPDEKMEEIKAECLDRVELDIKAIRAEAITEFVERLKAKKCHYTETENTFDFDGVTVEDIEQTEKELKEWKNE